MGASAQHELIVLTPFIDDYGAEFLLRLYEHCNAGTVKTLICRPLAEAHCGPAFISRRESFVRLGVQVYEYAVLSSLPSGRETFHAKAILSDDKSYYVGSSNMMGSALERSLECGVLVTGRSAKTMQQLISSVKGVSRRVPF